MKVKLRARQVYHKIAEVEIEIPNMKEEEVSDYLIENENLYDYEDEIDNKIDEAEYDYGFGLEDGKDNRDFVEELRFEICEKKKVGYLRKSEDCLEWFNLTNK